MGIYNVSNGQIEISTFNIRIFKYKFITINKIELTYPEKPELGTLILTRQQI